MYHKILGPYDTCGHGITDGLVESANKYHRTEILFSAERNIFVVCLLDKLYVTFQTFSPHPKQFKHVEAAAREALYHPPPQKKTTKLVTFPKKHKAEQFLIDFCALGDMLHCKASQQNVSWKHADTCKDHLWSKASVNN